jgi:hypothetical protein
MTLIDAKFSYLSEQPPLGLVCCESVLQQIIALQTSSVHRARRKKI